MEVINDRVMAYELATNVDLLDEEVYGGFSVSFPTLQASCVDRHSFDMDLDK